MAVTLYWKTRMASKLKRRLTLRLTVILLESVKKLLMDQVRPLAAVSIVS